MPASSRSRPGSSTRRRRVWKRPSQRRPPAPLRAEALLFLARVRYHSHDAGSALALAEQALEEVGDDEAAEAASPARARGGRRGGRRSRPRERSMPARPSHSRRPRATTRPLAEALALVGFHDFLAGEGDARGTMRRALGARRCRGVGTAAPEPDVPPSMCRDVDGRTRCRQIDLRGAGRSVAGKGATRGRSP